MRSAAAISVLLHAVVFGLLGVSFASCTGPVERGAAAPPRVIQAAAVPPREVETYYREQRARERQRLEAQEREQRERLKQEQRRAEAQAREQRERNKREQAERERRQALLQKKKREAAETRRLRQQQARAEREREQREAQRKAEEERLRKEQEAKRLAEEERLHKEQEAQRKAEEERLRKEQEAKRLAEEQQRLKMRKRQLAQWTRQYAGLLRASIERHWKKPPSSVRGGDCILKLRQNENGEVLDLDVVSCEGDRLFVRSVEEAVWKASPLPSPPSPEVFDADVELTFRQKY